MSDLTDTDIFFKIMTWFYVGLGFVYGGTGIGLYGLDWIGLD